MGYENAEAKNSTAKAFGKATTIYAGCNRSPFGHSEDPFGKHQETAKTPLKTQLECPQLEKHTTKTAKVLMIYDFGKPFRKTARRTENRKKKQEKPVFKKKTTQKKRSAKAPDEKQENRKIKKKHPKTTQNETNKKNRFKKKKKNIRRLGSPQILTRKWCVGEMVVARMEKVETLLLSFPGRRKHEFGTFGFVVF